MKTESTNCTIVMGKPTPALPQLDIQMKLIILNDSDGHANAYEYTLDNMKRLLALVLEANKHNTMMDDPKQGQQLLQDPNVTAE